MNATHIVELENAGSGPFAQQVTAMAAAGLPVPGILHLLAFKPRMSGLLSQFTQEVMRGPSTLSPGWRELIAAFTSRRNDCLF